MGQSCPLCLINPATGDLGRWGPSGHGDWLCCPCYQLPCLSRVPKSERTTVHKNLTFSLASAEGFLMASEWAKDNKVGSQQVALQAQGAQGSNWGPFWIVPCPCHLRLAAFPWGGAGQRGKALAGGAQGLLEPRPLTPVWVSMPGMGVGPRWAVPRADLSGTLHLPIGGVCGRHSCNALSLFGGILLDAGGGAAAMEQGGGREHAPRSQDEALLCHRLG